jgi:hypothetical protein
LPLVGVDHLLDLDPEFIERLRVGAKSLLRGVDSPKDSEIDRALREVEHEVRGHQIRGELGVRVPSFVSALDALHVLLRHRPRSISRGGRSG